mmetsp:Transcript_10009/g.16625  ORF Transcript_10009/g.16625 Transcript_10009/m.16625 type:complete len:203 (+) Transcript_10009:503-1111(+)
MSLPHPGTRRQTTKNTTILSASSARIYGYIMLYAVIVLFFIERIQSGMLHHDLAANTFQKLTADRLHYCIRCRRITFVIQYLRDGVTNQFPSFLGYATACLVPQDSLTSSRLTEIFSVGTLKFNSFLPILQAIFHNLPNLSRLWSSQRSLQVANRWLTSPRHSGFVPDKYQDGRLYGAMKIISCIHSMGVAFRRAVGNVQVG